MNPLAIAMVKYVLPWFAWLRSLTLPGCDPRQVLQEGRTKAWIMELVNNVDRTIPKQNLNASTLRAVQDCYRLAPFPVLWAVEGVGFYLGERQYRRAEPIDEWLSRRELKEVPKLSLSMLHAGLGISAAHVALDGISADAPLHQLEAAIDQFLDSCRSASQPGYVGCALESLGIPALVLHGKAMATRLKEPLRARDPEALSYMWHGVGRALYFHPRHFVPTRTSRWPGLSMIEELAAGDDDARLNMQSGFVWALTLVNMKACGVMESLLVERQKHTSLIRREAFVNGVVSSIMMRCATTPDDPISVAFVTHRAPRSLQVAEMWEDDIRQPTAIALKKILPEKDALNAIDDIFRYQALGDLIT